MFSRVKAWLTPSAKPDNVRTKKEQQCQHLMCNMRDCTSDELQQLTAIVTRAMVREGRTSFDRRLKTLHRELNPPDIMLTIQSVDPLRTNSPFHDIHAAIRRNPLYDPKKYM